MNEIELHQADQKEANQRFLENVQKLSNNCNHSKKQKYFEIINRLIKDPTKEIYSGFGPRTHRPKIAPVIPDPKSLATILSFSSDQSENIKMLVLTAIENLNIKEQESQSLVNTALSKMSLDTSQTISKKASVIQNRLNQK